MAMRPRGGGSSSNRRTARFSGAVRPVYEDFRPDSEWKQDNESHILNISLPGFMKEQIRVSTEGQNTLRVRGERLVAGNKWSRFLEDFQLPDNGEINSVRAKFQGGILNITIPKKEVRKPEQDINDVQKQQPTTPQKAQDKVLPEATNTIPRTDEISSKPKETSTDQKQPSPQLKGQEKTSPAVDTSQSSSEDDDDEEKSLMTHQESSRNEHDGRDQRGRTTTPLRFSEKKGDSEPKEKNIAPEKVESDHEREKSVDQKEREKELPEVGTRMKAAMERAHEAIINPEKKKGDSKELYGAFAKEKYKKAVKGLAELNEERQLLVNMGVAVLVIVALTAYVTYKFASIKD